MAQIPDLTEITTLADDDLLVTRDLDAAIDKKITWSNIKAELNLNGTHSNTQVLFNDNGVISGHSGLTYNGDGQLTLGTRLVAPEWRPASDSTTAIKIQNAAGTTDILTANTISPSISVKQIYSGYGTDNFFAGGAGNTAITTGTQNTAIGPLSMPSITSGVFNFSLGANTLRVLTTGTRNIAIGVEALRLTNGNQNLGVGHQALQNVTGNQNVAIGSQSLQRVTGGSGNVGLGNYSGYGEVGNVSNKLHIANTDARSLIYGDFSANTLAIGFTSLTPGTAAGDFAPSTTSRASLRLRSGTAPTSPNDGDIWYNGTNFQVRVGGTTYNLDMTPA